MNSIQFPVSDELASTFAKAKGQTSIRSLKIKIIDEKFELESTGTASSFSIDFNSFQKTLHDSECCFIAFRYKDAFQEKPWALIMYTPDSCLVKDKMSYASAFASLRDALGVKFFSKLKRYSSPSEFSWNEFQNSVSDEIEEGGEPKPKSQQDKPWNKREIAIHQLEKEEADARREFEEIAQSKAVEASGFSQVSFPFTPEAEEACKNIINGEFNWIELNVDDPPTKIDVGEKKLVSPAQLSSAVDPSSPQFYIYYFENTVVLIFSCPEAISGGYSQTIKKRMVYSSCKGTTAQTIKSFGLANVKKFDIRDPSELTANALSAQLKNKSSSIFDGSTLKPATAPASAQTSNRTFPKNNSNPPSKIALPKQTAHQPGSLAGLMANTGTGSAPASGIKKKVVLPPSGAYC